MGQLADARARGFTDSHPDVIALANQLKIAQVAAAREPAGATGGTPNPLYMSLQSMQAEKARSEEHTSELQSLMRISYAVFCLKKKNKKQRSTTQHYI